MNDKQKLIQEQIDLEDQLEDNESEQMELRSIERGLRERLDEIDAELERIEDEELEDAELMELEEENYDW